MDLMLENLAVECLKRGIPVSLTLENGELALVVEGFYKSGTVTVSALDQNSSSVKSRYGEINFIENFDHLVGLNFKWWERSRTKFEGWKNPSSYWVDDMVRLGFITKTSEVVYEPTY